MAITFAQFTDLVRQEVNLGANYDAIYESKIRQCIRSFEKKLTFPYMRNGVNLTGGTTFNAGDLKEPIVPNFCSDINIFKNIEFIRITDPLVQNQSQTGQQFHYIQKVDPLDIFKNDAETKWPKGFWYETVAGVITSVVFDRQIYQQTDAYAIVNTYTDPAIILGNGGNNTHWLLNNAELALLYGTLVLCSPRIREVDLLKMYGAIFDLEWDILVNHVEEFDYNKAEIKMEPYRDLAGS